MKYKIISFIMDIKLKIKYYFGVGVTPAVPRDYSCLYAQGSCLAEIRGTICGGAKVSNISCASARKVPDLINYFPFLHNEYLIN